MICVYICDMLGTSVSEVCLCPGYDLTLTCSTNETFLRWHITNGLKFKSRLVSLQGVAGELEPLMLSSTVFNISKVSENEVLPLISTIMVYSVSTGLNGTSVNCSEIAESGQTQKILMKIIHIIGASMLHYKIINSQQLIVIYLTLYSMESRSCFD